MFCDKCGKPLIDGASFCPSCGAPVPEPLTPDEVIPNPDDGGDSEQETPDEPDSEKSDHDSEPSPVDDQDKNAHAEKSDNAETSGNINDKKERKTLVKKNNALVAILICAIIVAGIAIFIIYNLNSAPLFKLEDIEDDVFRTYLSITADTNHDGGISQAEADAVTQIGSDDSTPGDLTTGLNDVGLSSLDGVEHFENVVEVICPNNNLTELDLSNNTHLERVDCTGNQIADATLPTCENLTTIHLEGNDFTEINLLGMPNLTDVLLDDGVIITGTEFDDEEDCQKLSDMALVFAVATVPETNYAAPEDDLVTSDDIPDGRDADLIYRMIYPNVISTKQLNRRDNAYLDELDVIDKGTSTIVVPHDTGMKIIRSFYGSETRVDEPITSGGLQYDVNTDSWNLYTADGPMLRTITTEDWFSYGKIVKFNATISYTDGEAEAVEYRYRVMAIEDDESIFGYHLLSMYAEDADTDDSSSSNPDKATDEQDEDEKLNRLYDVLLGEHEATFLKAEGGNYNEQHNCYAAKYHPLRINVTEVDRIRDTIRFDIEAVIHAHDDLDNPQDGSDGDAIASISGLQTVLKVGNGMNEGYNNVKGRVVTNGGMLMRYNLTEDGIWTIEIGSVYYPEPDSAGYGVYDTYQIDLL